MTPDLAHDGSLSVPSPPLEPIAENGDDAGASAALEAVQDLQSQLDGAQLGITMASPGLGYAAEPVAASLIESAVVTFVELPGGVLHTISVVLSMGLVVASHMVVGEMLPMFTRRLKLEGEQACPGEREMLPMFTRRLKHLSQAHGRRM